MPIIFMLGGFPGSGKSTIAKALQEARPGSVLIQSDVIRHELFPTPIYDGPEGRTQNGILFPEIHRRIDRAVMSGSDVIYDATNLNHRARAPIYRIGVKRKVRVVSVFVYLALDALKRRCEARAVAGDPYQSDAGAEVAERMWWATKATDYDPNAIPVTGVNEVDNNVAYILAKIEDDTAICYLESTDPGSLTERAAKHK